MPARDGYFYTELETDISGIGSVRSRRIHRIKRSLWLHIIGSPQYESNSVPLEWQLIVISYL